MWLCEATRTTNVNVLCNKARPRSKTGTCRKVSLMDWMQGRQDLRSVVIIQSPGPRHPTRPQSPHLSGFSGGSGHNELAEMPDCYLDAGIAEFIC